MLADFFLAGPSGDTGPAAGDRFVVLDPTVKPGPMREQCRRALSALPPGGALVLARRLGAGGWARRLAALLTLPLWLAAAERVLRGGGATGVRRYGVSPDLRAPAVVFPLGTPAARYAEAHLLPGPGKPLLS